MNGEWVDYYEALELEFGCTDEEIKKNYRNLMKKYHPDSQFADEVKAREVNNAYEVLGDPDKRAEYDSTYLQYKNGEFQEETQEVPKYTHEEMHETFTEEEIRFAKRVAMQQTIAETLDNAKIIIDAKNELLFAAFNDAYDKETYKTEYQQFITITDDFINNLQELAFEASEFGLDSEIEAINQVINFLTEMMEEIPKSLKDAKRKVKVELIKEQLEGEAEDALNNAEAVRNEFVSLYAKVYHDNLSKDEFKTYYSILRVGLTDALSQLVEIYDLLKKAKLDDKHKEVGILIGKINKDLELYTGKYKVAKELGKRLCLKEQIEASMLSFTEYKAKMLGIMMGIIDNPTLDNAKLRVTEGRVLTDSFHSTFNKINKKDYDDSLFSESAKDLYRDALNIYKKRCHLHEKMTKVFDQTKKVDINDEKIEVLTEDVETAEEEIEAIKLLHDVYILLGQHEEYKELTGDEVKKQINKVNDCINRSDFLYSYLEEMLEYITHIAEAYDLYNQYKESGSLDGIEARKLSNKSDKYLTYGVSLRILANIATCGIIGYSIFLGDSEITRELELFSKTFNVSQDLLNGLFMAAGINIPLQCIAAGFKAKHSAITEKIMLYRQLSYCEQKYKSLLNGCDKHLQDVYQRALKI